MPIHISIYQYVPMDLQVYTRGHTMEELLFLHFFFQIYKIKMCFFYVTKFISWHFIAWMLINRRSPATPKRQYKSSTSLASKRATCRCTPWRRQRARLTNPASSSTSKSKTFAAQVWCILTTYYLVSKAQGGRLQVRLRTLELEPSAFFFSGSPTLVPP